MAEQVTALNFVRAESDTYFERFLHIEPMNTFDHRREPASVDTQDVIRMNRDTLYSAAVVDISQGATVTLPDTGSRYQTAMVVDQDHYIDVVLDRPGRHELRRDQHGSDFVAVAVRTLVDPENPDDVAAVHALQDQLQIVAPSAKEFTHPDWDTASLDSTRATLLELARHMPDTRGAFGSRSSTDPIKHLLGTAAGWGGLPVEQAHYVFGEPDVAGDHFTMTFADVPVRGFWSISIYGGTGYFVPNELSRYSVNSVTAQRSDDGSVTVELGGDPSRPNQIPLPDGWNWVLRFYQPEQAILDGSWELPKLQPA